VSARYRKQATLIAEWFVSAGVRSPAAAFGGPGDDCLVFFIFVAVVILVA